jgi:perosamine synthetase
LAGVPGVTFAAERPGYTNVYWMVSILVEPPYALSRDELISALRERGIDSRPFFHPMDTLPPYRSDAPRPVALHLSRCGLNLPSSPALTDAQIDYICDVLCALGRR